MIQTKKKRISKTYTSTIHNTYKILRCVCFSIHPNKTAHIFLFVKVETNWKHSQIVHLCAAWFQKHPMLHVYHLDMVLVQWNECNIVLTNYLDIFQRDEFASSTCHLDLIFAHKLFRTLSLPRMIFRIDNIAIYASIQLEYLQNQDY